MRRVHILFFFLLLLPLTVSGQKQKQLVVLHTNDIHSTRNAERRAGEMSGPFVV